MNKISLMLSLLLCTQLFAVSPFIHQMEQERKLPMSPIDELCIDAKTQQGPSAVVRLLSNLARSYQHYSFYESMMDEVQASGTTVEYFCIQEGPLAHIVDSLMLININFDPYLETSPGMSLVGSSKAIRDKTMQNLGVVNKSEYLRIHNGIIKLAREADSWATAVQKALELSLFKQRERAFHEVNRPHVLWRGRVTDVIGNINQYKNQGEGMNEANSNKVKLLVFDKIFTNEALANYYLKDFPEDDASSKDADLSAIQATLGQYLEQYVLRSSFPVK